jgi:hypothetical protein
MEMGGDVRVAIRQRRTILVVLLVPALVISTLVSVILLGSTSNEIPTGKTGAVVTAVNVDLDHQGIPIGHVIVAATISAVDPYWATFLVEGRKPIYAIPSVYGFAHFQIEGVDRAWVVVASGTADVGCSSQGQQSAVPHAVLVGFGHHCPSG